MGRSESVEDAEERCAQPVAGEREQAGQDVKVRMRAQLVHVVRSGHALHAHLARPLLGAGGMLDDATLARLELGVAALAVRGD